MASVQSLCTVFATSPKHCISSSSNARRRSHHRITCSDGAEHKPSPEGRVDRRNMLLGMGGLYGLLSDPISDVPRAHAAPILAPESCKVADVSNTTGSLDLDCCPPINNGAIRDYKLPRVARPRRRQAAHELSAEYLAKYEEAVCRMRELDKTDPTDPRGFTQQANIHCAYCNGAYDVVEFNDVDFSVHYSWIFFPFHRWYLYFHERILGSLIGDPDFALPYWNWDNPKGMQMPLIYNNYCSPLYDEYRNAGNRPPATVSLQLNPDFTDPKQIILNNLSIMHKNMISEARSVVDFMGQPYRAGDPVPERAKGGTLENGAHIAVHVWVGDPTQPFNEDLGNFYSAGRDPLFFAHHSNVDRLWVIWKTLKSGYRKEITDPDYLDTSFLFYDENKHLVRVKVRDCIDERKMGYEYEKSDIPWVQYRPSKRKTRAAVKEITKGAKTAEEVFPATLVEIVRVLVTKPTKGKADEVLVVEDIQTDPTKLVKFDVYVNDGDDKPRDADKAEYAGSFTQLPRRVSSSAKTKINGSLRLYLKELYEDIDIADDDDVVVVTIVARFNGQDVTVGGVKIIPTPATEPAFT